MNVIGSNKSNRGGGNNRASPLHTIPDMRDESLEMTGNHATEIMVGENNNVNNHTS